MGATHSLKQCSLFQYLLYAEKSNKNKQKKKNMYPIAICYQFSLVTETVVRPDFQSWTRGKSRWIKLNLKWCSRAVCAALSAYLVVYFLKSWPSLLIERLICGKALRKKNRAVKSTVSKWTLASTPAKTHCILSLYWAVYLHGTDPNPYIQSVNVQGYDLQTMKESSKQCGFVLSMFPALPWEDKNCLLLSF